MYSMYVCMYSIYVCLYVCMYARKCVCMYAYEDVDNGYVYRSILGYLDELVGVEFGRVRTSASLT